MIECIQINFRKKAVALSLLRQTTRERRAGILILSEPPLTQWKDRRSIASKDRFSAVALTDIANIAPSEIGAGKGFFFFQV